jgi:hypothetical protein
MKVRNQQAQSGTAKEHCSGILGSRPPSASSNVDQGLVSPQLGQPSRKGRCSLRHGTASLTLTACGIERNADLAGLPWWEGHQLVEDEGIGVLCVAAPRRKLLHLKLTGFRGTTVEVCAPATVRRLWFGDWGEGTEQIERKFYEVNCA